MKTIVPSAVFSYKYSFIFCSLLCVFSSSHGQNDELMLYNDTKIVGKIVEEVLGSYVRIQDGDYQLHRVPDSEIQSIHRPLAIKGFWEAVYLRDGGMIQGFLIEYERGRLITLEDYRKNSFSYQWDEIIKIVKEPIGDDPYLEKRSLNLMRKTRQQNKVDGRKVYPGYGLLFAEGGAMIATENREDFYPGLFAQAILSLYITERISLGIGAGVDWIRQAEETSSLGQYGFIDSRFYVPKDGWTPYFAVAGGYDLYRRGVFVNPGAGVRKKLFKKFWFNGNISVKFQNVGEETFSQVFGPGPLEMLQFKIVID